MAAFEDVTDPHHPDYEKLKREALEGEEVKKQRLRDAPYPPDPHAPSSRAEAIERRGQADEASIHQRQVEGRINAREAGYEINRADNDLVHQEKKRDAIEAKQRQIDERMAAVAKENALTLSEQTKDLERVRSRYDAADENPFRQEGEFERKPDRFSHDRARFDKAQKEQYRPGDLYGSHQRAVGTEYAEFKEEQSELEKKIKNEFDFDRRSKLENEKQTRAADYIAYTSERITKQNERLTGTPDNERSTQHRERQNEYQKMGDRLREEARDRANQGQARELSSEHRQTDGHNRESGDRAQVQIARTDGTAEAPSRPKPTGRNR